LDVASCRAIYFALETLSERYVDWVEIVIAPPRACRAATHREGLARWAGAGLAREG